MRSLSIAVFGCVLAISLFRLGGAARTSEVDAKVFAKDASSRIFNAYNKITEREYNSKTDKDFEELDKNNKIIGKELVEISKQAKLYDTSNFKDTELKLAIEALRQYAGFHVLDVESYDEIFRNLNSLSEMVDDKNIKPFPNTFSKNLFQILLKFSIFESSDADLAYYPDIQKVLAESNNSEELKYYWEAWREKNNEWAASHFYSIVEIFGQAAEIFDMHVLDFWFEYYDKDFLMEMENVMKEIKPFYQELHAFIRSQLTRRYGPKIVSPTGPIPDHLFQQVLVQAWRNGSVIENSFASHLLPPYDKFVQEKNFDGRKLLEIAENFYTSLGLEPMSEDFWKNRVKKLDYDLQLNAEYRSVIYVSTPKVFVEYCDEVDFRKFMQAHGYMGWVHYAKAMEHLPAYFFGSYDLDFAVGEAVILSASTPKHLAAIGMASNYKFTDDVLMNRLLRMGIHTMLNVPVYFVHNKVMYDLLNGTIDMEGINKHYWSLMETYVGVEPPSNRPENSLDLPHKFYTDMNANHQARKFATELLGYQFYRSLCKMSGQTGELHNCDFYKSKEAGAALKEMMSLGSSKPWREVISRLLPENPALSADGLLEYYAPVQSWLAKKNKESNVKIGWDASKKTVL